MVAGGVTVTGPRGGRGALWSDWVQPGAAGLREANDKAAAGAPHVPMDQNRAVLPGWVDPSGIPLAQPGSPCSR